MSRSLVATPVQWSVMIPTYNPDGRFLRETLESVLRQDLGPDAMQIEVVDDGSTNGVPVELVRQIAGDRISVHCENRNRGLAAIWNLCIERAKGEWIHILHQDDIVLPGFYERSREAIDSSLRPGLFYCRHALVDGEGHWTSLSGIDARNPGILPDALELFCEDTRIQTPAVMVKKSVYEAIGGFKADLCYTLDWEMWCRTALNYPVWYEPRILACYRQHASSETARLVKQGRTLRDLEQCVLTITSYLPAGPVRSQIRRRALNRCAMGAIRDARKNFALRRYNAGMSSLRGALSLSSSLPVLLDIFVLIQIETLRLLKNFASKPHAGGSAKTPAV